MSSNLQYLQFFLVQMFFPFLSVGFGVEGWVCVVSVPDVLGVGGLMVFLGLKNSWILGCLVGIMLLVEGSSRSTIGDGL